MPGHWSSYIGFTELEVQKLCDKYHKDFAEVKRWYDGYVLEMLMCDKVTHKKLIDSNLLFRKISRNLLSKMIQYNSKKIFF